MIVKTLSAIMDMMPRSKHKSAQNLAHRLGWFSVALGLAEIAAARRVAGFLGVRGSEPVLALYGLREIGTGIAILTSSNPAPGVWARVAGDTLDLISLMGAFPDSRSKGGVTMAFASVAAITAIDLICAQTLSTDMKRKQAGMPDYGNRPGFPGGITAARSAAKQIRVGSRVPAQNAVYAGSGS